MTPQEKIKAKMLELSKEVGQEEVDTYLKQNRLKAKEVPKGTCVYFSKDQYLKIKDMVTDRVGGAKSMNKMILDYAIRPEFWEEVDEYGEEQ